LVISGEHFKSQKKSFPNISSLKGTAQTLPTKPESFLQAERKLFTEWITTYGFITNSKTGFSGENPTKQNKLYIAIN
jgi:hypothetical protein